MNNKKRTSTLLMLIVTVAVILIATLVIVLTANNNELAHGQDNELENNDNKISTDNEKEKEIEKPDSVNALLIGFDKSNGLSDVVMVAHLDTETNQVKLISLPRDLLIDFRKSGFDKIKQKNNIKASYCKLTEVYSNAGWDDDALLVVKDVVEEITQLEIDYTAAVNIDGFKAIVDAIGGVEFYVPQRMHYTDRVQGLYIDLHEGLQLMDGDKAEQLVRNRKYSGSPDLKRIKVQQDFLIAMSNKILKIRDFDKITDLASTVYGLLKTDFGLVTANEYVSYIFDLNLSELLTSENRITVPSDGTKMNHIWYQTWDKQEVLDSIDELLNKKPETPEETDTDEKTTDESEKRNDTESKNNDVDDNEKGETSEAMNSINDKNNDDEIEFLY